jgi:thioredoxin 1
MSVIREYWKVAVMTLVVLGAIWYLNKPDGPPGGKVGVLSDASFDREVINSPIPVAVEFRSKFCSACKMFRGKFESASVKFDGKMKFFELDINESSSSADRYGIEALPTIYFFANGKVAGSLRGNVSKDILENSASEVINRTAAQTPGAGAVSAGEGCKVAATSFECPL